MHVEGYQKVIEELLPVLEEIFEHQTCEYSVTSEKVGNCGKIN